MIDLCENLKDRFAILDCPKTRDIEVVRRWRRRTDSSYCAYYWPWIGMAASDGAIARIPPSGFMAGTIARVDYEIGVHQAPANVPLRAAVDLSLPVSEDHQGILNSEQINTFRLSRGIRPWGARTASSDPDWRFLNVRRLFIMMRRSLEQGSQWVMFEPNYHKTWEILTDMVTAFLREMFDKGMFARGNPEDCFYVKCDEETNPSDAVNKGLLTCEIGVAPAVPAEFIMIRVTQKMGEAAAGAGAAP
jgi:phage tail sheath protein FI